MAMIDWKAVESEYNFSPRERRVVPVKWWPEGDESSARPADGATVKTGGKQGRAAVFDFGKEIGGRVTVGWGAVRGGGAELCFSEAREWLPRGGDDLIEFMPALLSKHFYVGGGGREWRDPVLRGGFRYLRIGAPPWGGAEIKKVEVEADFYIPPNGEYPGAFVCSESDLTRIWYAAAYTAQAATIRPGEAWIYGADRAGVGDWILCDGAKRDRQVWNLDLAAATPTFLYSLWEPSVIRDSYRTILAHKGGAISALRNGKGYIPHTVFPPNKFLMTSYVDLQTFAVYVMWWVRGAITYVRHTGDLDFAASVMKDIAEAFDWMEARTRKAPGTEVRLFYADGLNDLSWDYTVLRRGFVTVTNIVWAHALEEAAEMSGWLGVSSKTAAARASERDRWRVRAKEIRAALLSQKFRPYPLLDESTGLFRFSNLHDGPLNLEANGTALLAGLTPPEKAPEVFRALAERLGVPWGRLSTEYPYPWVPDKRHSGKAMPFLTALEIEALFRHGRGRDAIRLMRANWLPMLEQDPRSTFWEWYGDGGRLDNTYASRCHPWSSTVLRLLNEYVVGVRPVGPGFSRFEVRPVLCGLDSAACRVPSPLGPLEVYFEQSEKPAPRSGEKKSGRKIKSAKWTFDVPDGSGGRFFVPSPGRAEKIKASGKTVRDSGGRGVFILKPGESSVEVKFRA